MTRYPQSDTIRRVFTKGQPLSFGKGQIIIGNSHTADGVYFIDTGYVKVYSINDDGSHNIRILFGSGELFPLIGAYIGTINDALYYESVTSCVLWRISREWFQDMITTDFEVSKAMALQLAQQADMYANRLENLEYRTGPERVAYRLLYLASRFGVREKDVIKIEAPITHEIFASTVNLVRESVSRELERLEKEGLITRDRRAICILDAKGLAAKLSRPIDLTAWRLD